MSTGIALFLSSEAYWAVADAKAALECYKKSMEAIIAREDVTQTIPPSSMRRLFGPDAEKLPRETIWLVWRNIMALFRDPEVAVTPENAREPYNLVLAFRPGAHKGPHDGAFEKRGPQGLFLLKAIQITALTTLGLLAWDRGDRATAAKRYQQVIDLAETEDVFANGGSMPRGTVARDVYADYKHCQTNLEVLKRNDTINAALLNDEHVGRRDVRRMSLAQQQLRVEADGTVNARTEVSFATHVCYKCGKRDVAMKRCSLCRKATYCTKECQKADWAARHKEACIPTVPEETQQVDT
ncbi:hypothetical protein AURDEDRAFT_166334 [Auricularia subglabra TFB-10046 SS5]|uniref:MYND-type domain-containing protein n=1 Tax=Auricularia subglabra (strain TFB-10046 / SS5) TaxID=717982 RepID=J0LKL2_AURST|nr:hypothetical protein AURDEDRAFT_166334 [Auricularia subglabra TFB-10046 SS5]